MKYSGTTPKLYTYHVGKFLDFTNNAPLRVTNDDVLNYNIHIRDLSYSTRNLALNAIKAYFRLILKRNTKDFATIRPPKHRRAVKSFDYLGICEKIKAIDNIKHRAILSLGLGCWLRVGEVLNLKITDVDKATKTIRINNSKGCKDRNVIMTESLLKLLREYYKAYRPKEYLFNGQSSMQYSASSVGKLVKKYLGDKYRFHNLRSAGSAYAHKEGTSLYDISDMLGHAKIETSKYYLPKNVNTIPSLI